jgi:hypothetical protein
LWQLQLFQFASAQARDEIVGAQAKRQLLDTWFGLAIRLRNASARQAEADRMADRLDGLDFEQKITKELEEAGKAKRNIVSLPMIGTSHVVSYTRKNRVCFWTVYFLKNVLSG